MNKNFKFLSWLLLVTLLGTMLASCAPAATPAPTQPPAPAATEAPAVTQAPAAGAVLPCGEPGKKIVIGLSNGYFGTDWRTQDLNVAQQVFDEMKQKGWIAQDSVLKIQNAGADTNQQIQQFRNMVNEKVDVLMVNANSATGLNAVIDEAKAAGIPVISFDQAVTNPYAVNVTVDHYAWGKRYAEWLAEALGGKGKVVLIDGLPGHPAAEARKQAAKDVFAQYPDIEIVQEIYGMWDQAKAQAATTDLLAAVPELDGIFVEDSMAMGVMRALQAANRTVRAMTGEATPGYLKMWKEQLAKQPDFQSFAQANPPGISGSAIKIAALVAIGCKLDEIPNNTFYYPISKFGGNEALDQFLKEMEGKPETYFLDEWLTDEQALKLFNGVADEAAAPEQPAAAEPAAPAVLACGEPGKKIVIGLSNGYFGTDWRTQDLNVAQQVFDEMKQKGWIAQDSVLKIQNAGADTNQQIQQFRNMVNEKVDVLMVNANSATGLNAVIDEAKAAGIPVISFDQAVTNPYAVNVTVDHYAWGKRYAEWLAEALGGKGKVVLIDGLPGHPAAEARKQAAKDVFAQYPDIEIVQEIYGMWDQAKAQAATTDLLAAVPELDGIFVEDSMAMGVMRALQAANRTVRAMTGEATPGYLKMWKEQLAKQPDFQSFAQANPPGISGSAIKIAALVAIGCKLDEIPNNTFYYPISKFGGNEALDQFLKEMEGKPETYFLDEWLTDEQVLALFQ